MPEMVGIPEIFQTPEFRRLFILAEIGNFTPEEMEEYENSLKNMSDYYNIIDSAEKRARDEGRIEGERRGLEKGRGEGREEAKREDAIKLREHGVDVSRFLFGCHMDCGCYMRMQSSCSTRMIFLGL